MLPVVKYVFRLKNTRVVQEYANFSAIGRVKIQHKKRARSRVGWVASCPLKSGQKPSHVTCPVVTGPHFPTCSLPIASQHPQTCSGPILHLGIPCPCLAGPSRRGGVQQWQERGKVKIKVEMGDGPRRTKWAACSPLQKK